MALKLLPEDLSDVPPHLADRYESQAGRYWDLFYRRNTTKFFKDRHYLHKEFPDLVAGPATLLEVGCGVGNTVFPLHELNPCLRIFCCDFAPSAIELVRQNPLYAAAKGAVQAFVADITSDHLSAPVEAGGCGVPEGGCDLATMVFVLSAIHPQRMAAAIHNVAACLRPGSGRLLFRDYAEGDLAQERLAGGDRPKRLGHNFYVRGDGTRCYYFGQEEVVSLFAAAGFRCDRLALHERTVVNHKRDIAMDRRWLQAVFTLQEPQPPPLPLPLLLAQPPPLTQQTQPAAPAQAASAAAAAAAACCSFPAGGSMGGAGSSGGASGGEGGGAGLSSNGGAALLGGGGSWLTGAAGRLASHLAAGPGHPSGRALLPDSLDAADELRAQLSPSPRANRQHHPHQPLQHPLQDGYQQQPPHQQADSLWAAAATGGGGGGGGGGCFATQYQQHCSSAEQQQQPGESMQVEVAGGAAGSQERQPREEREGSRRQLRAGSSSGGGGDVAMGECSDAGRSLENELEAEFFATIGRDSAEVVAEEVAAAGAALARVRLVELQAVAAARLTAAASAGGGEGGSMAAGVPTPLAHPHPQQQHAQHLEQQQWVQQQQEPQPEVEAAVEVVAGVSFRCMCGVAPETGSPAVPPAALALARVFLTCPRLLAGKCALQLGPATLPQLPTAATSNLPYASCPASTTASRAVQMPVAAAALPAMAAVRSSARRVVVSEPAREGLAAVAADLRRNAHALVIERVKLSPLDWAAAAAASSGGAAATAGVGVGGGIANGYTYVSGAVRQIRDLLQVQPGGYDIIYAADPLAAVTAAATAPSPSLSGAGPSSGAEAAVAAARGLFESAAQLMHPSAGTAAATTAGEGKPLGLLLLCFPAGWAAAHGLGLAALAGMYGWELLVSEQLGVAAGGVTVGTAAAAAAAAAAGVEAAAASTGCAIMGFRMRRG